METKEIQIVIDNQQKFFVAGKTLSIQFRLENLKKLSTLLFRHEEEIKIALWNDFHMPESEVISTETRFVIKKMNPAIRKLRHWNRIKHVRTPLVHFIANSYIVPQPYGQVLVLSPRLSSLL